MGEIIEPDHSGFDSTDDKGSKAAAKRKAKRQKAKEREKEKRRLEKLEIAVQKAKEESNSRCGACGEGILGCGFEKYGVNFAVLLALEVVPYLHNVNYVHLPNLLSSILTAVCSLVVGF